MTIRQPTASAIVIMAKEPVAGRVKTRLVPPLSFERAALLARAFLDDTMALVARMPGVQLAIAITPPSAVETWGRCLPGSPLLLGVDGADIGDCLAEATRSLFDAGFARVVAVNADSPTMPRERLDQALARLEDTDVVIGPSDDGGYYLVGLERPRAELFRSVTWSSANVAIQTLACARNAGCSILGPRAVYDVDTPADLERLMRDLAGLPGGAPAATRRVLAAAIEPDRQGACPVCSHTHRAGTHNRETLR